MENPLGLLRNQIYRLFNSKTTQTEEPSAASLRTLFPWADDKEIEIIRKERLYLDADFIADSSSNGPASKDQ